ncbi:hypothetical protein ACSBL2_20210 [Pedobacter sp. AW31-3R]|uniref:hypothetical protein n=1 Tax=Pedobacter sp. AW31-3R TaxID=3445781 RepID=UPI003F9FFC7C
MKTLFAFLVSITLFTACKKEQPAAKEDLYPDLPLEAPSSSAINTFYKNTSFYELYVYRYDPSTEKWTNRIRGHYPTVSADDPSYIGFTNPYVVDSGVSMFDMVRLYTTEIGGSNIKTAAINADKVLQFFPDYEGAKTGIVKIRTQDVVITKVGGAGTFTIGISGGGTYDESTQLIDLKVTFDETAIGGPGQTVLYKFSVTALSLN